MEVNFSLSIALRPMAISFFVTGGRKADRFTWKAEERRRGAKLRTPARNNYISWSWSPTLTLRSTFVFPTKCTEIGVVLNFAPGFWLTKC